MEKLRYLVEIQGFPKFFRHLDSWCWCRSTELRNVLDLRCSPAGLGWVASVGLLLCDARFLEISGLNWTQVSTKKNKFRPRGLGGVLVPP